MELLKKTDKNFTQTLLHYTRCNYHRYRRVLDENFGKFSNFHNLRAQKTQQNCINFRSNFFGKRVSGVVGSVVEVTTPNVYGIYTYILYLHNTPLQSE